MESLTYFKPVYTHRTVKHQPKLLGRLKLPPNWSTLVVYLQMSTHRWTPRLADIHPTFYTQCLLYSMRPGWRNKYTCSSNLGSMLDQCRMWNWCCSSRSTKSDGSGLNSIRDGRRRLFRTPVFALTN